MNRRNFFRSIVAVAVAATLPPVAVASPAAVTVPFATLPIGHYIRGPRQVITFERIVTPQFRRPTPIHDNLVRSLKAAGIKW